MNYFLNAGVWGNVFAVPAAVVDDYLKIAPGSAVKVLLYILRNNGRNISRDEITNALNLSPDDANDAFNFWEGVGIIGRNVQNTQPVPAKPDNDVKAGKIKTMTFEKSEVKPEKERADEIKPHIQNSSSGFQITPTEAEKLRQSSNEMKALFDMAQQALGNVINHTTIRSLVWQHEYLGLKVDVILMLLSYCASIGKTHIAYIETIAVNWSQNDINTLDKAQDEIQRMTNTNSFYSKMSTAFGLKRQPTPNQKKFFDEWHMKGYSADLISCACERATDLGKTMTVNYVNGILENWHKKGISTREGAETEIKSKRYGKTQENRSDQSYDINEFEKFAVTFSKNIKKEN